MSTPGTEPETGPGGSPGERHPLDEHLERVHQAQQGRRRSLLSLLVHARRAEGDDAGEAAFATLLVVMIAIAVVVLGALAGLGWLIYHLVTT